MRVQRGDTVRGWFGTGLVTDVGEGWLEKASVPDVPVTPIDDLVRIKQVVGNKTYYEYIYQSDVKEIL